MLATLNEEGGDRSQPQSDRPYRPHLNYQSATHFFRENIAKVDMLP
ncbi:hypothetical protein NG799_17185 [Laspinema sp. D1]|uniref:Uncharacterized protein n=1 Tax=Laspinema palackyanum D2a TaxID=2953684 RepID=A0ABT2MTI1_9CYAN|nr:hypothetical protein [Laspinema sp. D2a]